MSVLLFPFLKQARTAYLNKSKNKTWKQTSFPQGSNTQTTNTSVLFFRSRQNHELNITVFLCHIRSWNSGHPSNSMRIKKHEQHMFSFSNFTRQQSEVGSRRFGDNNTFIYLYTYIYIYIYMYAHTHKFVSYAYIYIYIYVYIYNTLSGHEGMWLIAPKAIVRHCIRW